MNKPDNLNCTHQWTEEYYGHKCAKCGDFIPYGCEPWMPDEDECMYSDDALRYAINPYYEGAD